MFLKNIRNLNIKNKDNFGEKCFFCGTFFLASALPISAFFYLLSMIISLWKFNKNFFKDKYNQILFLSSGVMIFSNVNAFLNMDNISDQNTADVWLDLFNWVPLFLLFISSQIYLKHSNQRKIFSKFLISGTIPVLISCIMQACLGIEGPLKSLNGLIVWYLDKLDYSDFALSGLFSNRNYTATWLSAVLSFGLFELLDKRGVNPQKVTVLTLNFIIVLFTIFTFSRNGIISIFITFIIIFRKFKIIIPLISFYSISNLFFLALINRNIISLQDLISLRIARLFILNLKIS